MADVFLWSGRSGASTSKPGCLVLFSVALSNLNHPCAHLQAQTLPTSLGSVPLPCQTIAVLVSDTADLSSLSGTKSCLQAKALADMSQRVRMVQVACLHYREEVFGPVFVIVKFTTDAEAVALANDCPFGLGSTVFSRSKDRANSIARQLQVRTALWQSSLSMCEATIALCKSQMALLLAAAQSCSTQCDAGCSSAALRNLCMALLHP